MTENRDWRDPAKERDPEDDETGIGGWRRKEDGTWEKAPSKSEEKTQGAKESGNGDNDQT